MICSYVCVCLCSFDASHHSGTAQSADVQQANRGTRGKTWTAQTESWVAYADRAAGTWIFIGARVSRRQQPPFIFGRCLIARREDEKTKIPKRFLGKTHAYVVTHTTVPYVRVRIRFPRRNHNIMLPTDVVLFRYSNSLTIECTKLIARVHKSTSSVTSA